MRSCVSGSTDAGVCAQDHWSWGVETGWENMGLCGLCQNTQFNLNLVLCVEYGDVINSLVKCYRRLYNEITTIS